MNNASPLVPVVTGRGLRTQSAGPFEVTLVEHRAGLRLGKHRHAEAVIGLLLGGVYDEWLDGRTVEPARASLLIKPPETPHANSIGREGTHTVLIQVRANAIPADLARVLATPAIHLHARVAAIGEAFVRELRHPDGPSEIGLDALVYELLGLAARRREMGGAGYSRRQQWVARVRDVVHESADHTFSLTELAASAGVDRAHLARTFRAVFGCTVGEYVRSARLSRAAGLLRSGRNSVSAIAAAVGFADHAHLTRNFSRAYGRSPTEYRRGA